MTIDQWVAKFKKEIENSTKSDFMRELGKKAAEIIRVRTRQGNGVWNGKKEKLKALSPNYVKQRAREKKAFTLSVFTTPKRSNLTLSGQLLESLDVISVKDDEVKVGPTGTRILSNTTNREISGFVENAGRTYLDLTAPEFKQLSNMLRKRILDSVRKGLT